MRRSARVRGVVNSLAAEEVRKRGNSMEGGALGWKSELVIAVECEL